MNPAVGLHVLPLEGTRAELLAPRLEQLMRERQQSLGEAATSMDRVSIEPDTASNSLIIAASEENLQVIRDLIDALIGAEADAVGGSTFEILQLASSRAVDVVDMLQDMYVEEVNRTRGPNTIRVTADERLNAVLVNAPPADVRTIRRLVAQLDGARPGSVVEIKYIPLSSANALETVSLIENILSGRGIGARRRSQQATVLKYLREVAADQIDDETGEPMTEMEVSAAIRESITLTPDLRTNTVIISAPKESMGMIEQMIRDMDASSTGSQNVRIFKLVNADAVAMAQILTDLFNLSNRGNLYVLKPREYPPGEGEPARLPGPDGERIYAGLENTELTAVPDDRQQLSITVDTRTNSLLVSGTPQYLDLVGAVVAELDALEANEREVFVYQLRNAVAGEVARVLSQFIETEQDKLIATIGIDQLGSAARLLERQVTIVGDDPSKTVLVIASPRYMQRVKDMIKELDVNPPQQVLSNPSIMAANNQPARIQIGENIRLPESTSFNLGSQQSSVVPEDIGIILEVTPSINPDGYVRMTITPEISELSARTTQISEDFSSPIITRRTATTTVTVRDGQMIILGGLISNRFERRDRKVPLLGDIPFFGALFRSSTETSKKTELLIVLTPHVSMSPTEIDRVDQITRDEIDRLSLTDEIKQQIRKNILDGTGGLYDAEGKRIDTPNASEKDKE